MIYSSQKPKLEESSAPAAKRGRRPGRRSIEPPEKKKKPEDSRTECCVCKQSGTNSNLVRYAGKFTIVTETITDLVYPPPPGIWHNHCLRFLLGRLYYPGEIMVHYGLGEDGEDFNVFLSHRRPFPHPEIPSSLFVCFYILLLL